jgi:hypothetical protein
LWTTFQHTLGHSDRSSLYQHSSGHLGRRTLGQPSCLPSSLDDESALAIRTPPLVLDTLKLPRCRCSLARRCISAGSLRRGRSYTVDVRYLDGIISSSVIDASPGWTLHLRSRPRYGSSGIDTIAYAVGRSARKVGRSIAPIEEYVGQRAVCVIRCAQRQFGESTPIAGRGRPGTDGHPVIDATTLIVSTPLSVSWTTRQG